MRKMWYFIGSAFLLFCCTNFLFGATKKDIQHAIEVYYIGDIPVLEVLYNIKNTGNHPLWVWFSKSNLTQCSDSIKVRDYFRKVKGDWSLYQLAMDGNVGDFKPMIFFSFIKVLQPQETFVIQVIAENYLSPEPEKSQDWQNIQENREKQQQKQIKQIITALEKHISIVPQALVLKQAPGMENEIVKKQFYYKPFSIAMTWQSFNSQLSSNPY